MPARADELRAMMRAKGWTNAQLAAHWGHSVSYVSWLINNPHERPRVYEDAFRGLLERAAVDVVLEARHKPKPRPRKWGVPEMYPLGRVFITQDSRLGPEEGSELVVRQVAKDGPAWRVEFEVLGGEGAGERISLEHGPSIDRLSDTGRQHTGRDF